MVPAKYPPKVKLEFLHNFRVLELGWIMRTFFWRSLGFYSGVESNSFACARSLFLMEKISINVRISWNPPCVRFLVVLGLYELGLILRRKSFPFRISWRPYNDQLNATCFLIRPPCVRSHRIRSPLAHLSSTIKPIQVDPSPPIFSIFNRHIRRAS